MDQGVRWEVYLNNILISEENDHSTTCGSNHYYENGVSEMTFLILITSIQKHKSLVCIMHFVLGIKSFQRKFGPGYQLGRNGKSYLRHLEKGNITGLTSLGRNGSLKTTSYDI